MAVHWTGRDYLKVGCERMPLKMMYARVLSLQEATSAGLNGKRCTVVFFEVKFFGDCGYSTINIKIKVSL